jgi:hypothetical protein
MSLEQVGGLLLAIATFVGLIVYRTRQDQQQRKDSPPPGRSSSPQDR